MHSLVDAAGLAAEIEIDSAGTGAWHVGEPADARSRDKARQHGVELTSRARQFVHEDFANFDYLLAMDINNYRDMRQLASDAIAAKKVRMFRFFDPASENDDSVPDPYYGSGDGFEHVFQICHAACTGLVQHIRKNDLGDV